MNTKGAVEPNDHENTATRQIIGVVGAGQMGSGIAQVAASAGYKVYLIDYEIGRATAGKDSIRGAVFRGIERGKISDEEGQNILERITPIASLEPLSETFFTIEAIVEKIDEKEELFRRLDEVLPTTSIIGSNTSSISISRLGGKTKRPDKFIGIHFMNPVPVMQLVEIICGLQTSEETYSITASLVERFGKIAVRGVDSPGFIVNRILMPMINEAIFLLHEGVKAKDIDNAMKLGTNQPMGPLALADFIGLDTVLFILQVLHTDLGEDKYRPCPLLKRYVDAGYLGKKSKRGFYHY
jgi:3-hydroxybutyryl-CoA dehydrogenase